MPDLSNLVGERLEVANVVLDSFFAGHLERRRTGMYVCWVGRKGPRAKRWQCRGQDFYPVWSRQYPGGGTSSMALSQLIRWVQGKPVLPLGTWRHWASDRVKLLPESAVRELMSAGYPEIVDCVCCNQPLHGRLDWWSLDGLSGPCCLWSKACDERKALNGHA